MSVVDKHHWVLKGSDAHPRRLRAHLLVGRGMPGLVLPHSRKVAVLRGHIRRTTRRNTGEDDPRT